MLHVALPISGNQLKNLTTRLREGTETPEDLHALADVLLYYQRVLATAHADLEALCADLPHAEPMAPRVKTLKTTLEKLHRQPGLRSLGQIRDLAGLRVVVHGTRADQDEVAGRIAGLFVDDTRPVKLIDRRVEPKSGYRAVHLEVRRDGILIEIQTRTERQHRWAELFERTADKLGRELRYDGQQPALTTQERVYLEMLQLTATLIDMAERDGVRSYQDGDLGELLDLLAQHLELL